MNNEQILEGSIAKKEKALLLLEKNKGMIVGIAKKFLSKNNVCDMDDYLQDAFLLLFDRVIDAYSSWRETRFSTYFHIALLNEFRETTRKFMLPFVVGRSDYRLAIRYTELKQRGLSDEEIIKKIGVSKRKLSRIKKLSAINKVELSTICTQDKESVDSFIETLTLSEEDKNILLLRRGGLTLREVGDIIKRSRTYVMKKEKALFIRIKKEIYGR